MRKFILGMIPGIVLGIIMGTLALIYNARIYQEGELFLLEYAGQIWEYNAE